MVTGMDGRRRRHTADERRAVAARFPRRQARIRAGSGAGDGAGGDAEERGGLNRRHCRLPRQVESSLGYNVHICLPTNDPPMSTTMTIRLEDDTKARLDKLAEATQRSRSFLAAEAIRDYVEVNEWQVGEIRKALKEADGGEFASDGEVKRVFDSWRRRRAG